MDKIQIDFEKLTIRDAVFLQSGLMSFADMVELLQRLVVGGVADKPFVEIPRLMAHLVVELKSFAEYMEPGQSMEQAIEVAKKKWAEDKD